ncbi:nuclear transport factor 2 family protein [Frigidibacter sp.]|uniref:nuclear transport factor 2 family protein n=1 Tax=Frigidibacter sp. TaxID=2586418 RepID=UPI0027332BDF|nr:nuclear transport factor 2 family protein [Frigidibacter sp.]MDP3340545.1 nuclear transport factor 2 family protein [Frigidibacter sp.]
MHLPAPIHTYFTATAPQDGEAFAAAFAADAIVHDEGQDHRGPEAIRNWWLAAKAKYRHSAEPLDVTEVAGKSVVRARVTGDFPGSPAILTFTFGQADDRITDLEIG